MGEEVKCAQVKEDNAALYETDNDNKLPPDLVNLTANAIIRSEIIIYSVYF